jgi:hypothetical protein
MLKKNWIFTGVLALVCALSMLLVVTCVTEQEYKDVPVYTITKVTGDGANYEGYADFTISRNKATEGTVIFLNITSLSLDWVVDSWTIGGLTTEVTERTPNQFYSFVMPGRNVTVNLSVRNTKADVGEEGDFALNLPAENYRASHALNGTPITNGFNGNWDNNAQLNNAGAGQGWFAVDLGSVIDIKAVRIVWGMASGASGNFNGMVNYAIQISNVGLPPQNNYTDDGWATVKIVNNPLNVTGVDRNTQNRVNTHILPQSIPAQFIRVKALSPFTEGAGAWTQWPAIASFEVYERDDINHYQIITFKSVGNLRNDNLDLVETRVDPPVFGETAYQIGDNFAPDGAKYTAKISSITPAIENGIYAPGTEYTFEFTFEMVEEGSGTELDPYFYFSTFRPDIFITDIGNQFLTMSDGGYSLGKMVGTFSFPMTESDQISEVKFIDGLTYPMTGFEIPDEDDFAADGSRYTATLVVERSTDGTTWTDVTETEYEDDMYYRFVFTVIAEDNYWFADDVTVQNIGATIPTFTGEGTDELIVTYAFDKTGGPLPIISGALTVVEPVVGIAAPALNAGNFASGAAPFTAQLTSLGGALEGGNFKLGEQYTYSFKLEIKDPLTHKFVNSSAVTFTVNGRDAVYQFVDDENATVIIAFARLNNDPRAIDLAYGITNTPDPRIFAMPAGVNTGASLEAPFNGDPTTGNWQSTDATNTNRTWFAVDLGAEYDIGTVQIRWMGAGGSWNGMVNFDIQIPEASATLPPEANYSDAGWTSVAEVRRPLGNRGDYVTDTVTVTEGTRSQWIRIQRADRATSSGEHTNWHGIASLEVYSEGTPGTLTPITTKAVTGIVAPVVGETPQAVGMLTSGANFTAELVSISGALDDGKFDWETEYVYNIKLVTDIGYRFTTSPPTLNGTPVAAANMVSNNGYEMVVQRSFTTPVQPSDTAFTVTFANGGTVTRGGLTATATTTSGLDKFDADETVSITVTVTGAATIGTIYTARLTSSSSVSTAAPVFVPGARDIAAASSILATRNIGVETIGSATQPAGHWTFIFTFVMPEDDVELTLVDTFKTDIAPGRPNPATTAISSALGNIERIAANAFNGEYILTQDGTDNRWESAPPTANTPGQWIAVDLGAEYNLEDIVLRARIRQASLDEFQIYVARGDAAGAAAFAALGERSTDNTISSADKVTLITGDDTGWDRLWNVVYRGDNTGVQENQPTYLPLFVNELGNTHGMTNTTANYNVFFQMSRPGPNNANGIGPYIGLAAANGYPTVVTYTQRIGRYVLLFIDSKINRTNGEFAPSLLNFEIYGTPVSP